MIDDSRMIVLNITLDVGRVESSSGKKRWGDFRLFNENDRFWCNVNHYAFSIKHTKYYAVEVFQMDNKSQDKLYAFSKPNIRGK